MPLCFEVSVNGGTPILAGTEHAAVLSVIAGHVSKLNELDVSVGGLVSVPGAEDEHWRWLRRDLQPGDEVRIRVLADAEASEPKERVRQSKVFDQEKEREYYEHLKKKYEGGA